MVLYGGRSSEHWVSCVSARHVVEAMDPERYEAIPIGITLDGRWMLPEASRKALEGGTLEVPTEAFEVSGEAVSLASDPTRHELVPMGDGRGSPIGPIDVVFPVLHGPYGEDGTVQGLLELADIPYVGAAVLGSAVAMDKEKMKILFAAAGLPVGRFVAIRESDWEGGEATEMAESLGFPCFTKPANLGSSVGITRCTNPGELGAGIEEALKHDRKILVEEAIVGRELECGVLGNDEPRASVVGEVLSAGEFYDYASKYFDEGSETIVPADLPDEVSERIRGYAVEAFRVVDAAGMARVDFFYDRDGRGVVINEINTIPGFTPISMFPKLWEATGLSYPELIDEVIRLAIERHEAKKRPEIIGLPDQDH